MFWIGLLTGTGITLAVLTVYGMRLRSQYRLEPRMVAYRHRTTDIAAEVEQIVHLANAERQRYFELQEARAVELCHCHGYDPADDEDDYEPPAIDPESLKKRFGVEQSQTDRYPDGYFQSQDGKAVLVVVRTPVPGTSTTMPAWSWSPSGRRSSAPSRAVPWRVGTAPPPSVGERRG